jgi:hypothetical protein
MGLRKSKHLIRTLLILICFQFTAAAVVSVEMDKSPAHNSFAAQKLSKPISISSLFEKTESENEENDKAVAVEYENFNFIFLDYLTPQQSVLRTDIVSFHIQEPSLFGLHCVFRI